MEAALRAALTTALGAGVSAARTVAGGDINDAWRVDLTDGRRLFVKTHARAPTTMYPAEAHGLRWLAAAGALPVPTVVGCATEGARPAWLALEWIEPGRRAPDFAAQLGRGLASLHAYGAPCFGLERANFIGSLPQENTPRDDWATFYGEARLRPQLTRAVDAGLIGGPLRRRVDHLIARLAELAGPPEPPARLHGDLWSGNVHCGPDGGPWLIDPAVYGGHREVDLAMLDLFGGLDPRALAAYHEASPLAPGHRDRIALYQLYPLLVHVNLFGAGYVSGVERCIHPYG